MKKSYALASFFSLILSLFFTTPVIADFTIGQPPNSGIRAADNPNANNTISAIVTNAIAIIFTIAAVAFVFMIIWGAFEWIISAGDKEKVAKARNRLTNAIIGIVLLALAFVIINTIGQIIGLNPLGNLSLPNLQNMLSPR